MTSDSTPAYDLVVSGGTAVTLAGVHERDIAVRGETIAAVGLPGEFDGLAGSSIDAAGCLVFPGGIDPHVHYALRLPGINGQTIPDESQEQSYAAALGGTTTFIDFALWEQGMTLLEAVDRKQRDAVGNTAVDYALHALFVGNPPFEVIEEIGEVIAAGIPTLKTASACPPWTSDDGHMMAIMTEIARHGGLHLLHAEDQAMLDWLTEKYRRDGKTHGAYTAETRSPLAEEAAIRRAILIAERVNCPLYVLHVSTALGATAIAEARRRGRAVFGETLVCYLSFTAEKLWDEPNGLVFQNWPPLRQEADQDALWVALNDDDLQVVSSDHYAVTIADRYATMGDTIEGGGQTGQAAIELRLPVLFELGVQQGRISLQRFVDLVSTNPAKLMGLYPRKGVLEAGSDADIVVWDPGDVWTVRHEDLHMDVDYNCWDGWTLRGRTRTTILRGLPVVRDREWVGDRAGGRFIERRFEPRLAGRPVHQAQSAAAPPPARR